MSFEAGPGVALVNALQARVVLAIKGELDPVYLGPSGSEQMEAPHGLFMPLAVSWDGRYVAVAGCPELPRFQFHDGPWFDYIRRFLAAHGPELKGHQLVSVYDARDGQVIKVLRPGCGRPVAPWSFGCSCAFVEVRGLHFERGTNALWCAWVDMSYRGTGEHRGKSWAYITRYDIRTGEGESFYSNPGEGIFNLGMQGSADGSVLFLRTGMDGVSGELHWLFLTRSRKRVEVEDCLTFGGALSSDGSRLYFFSADQRRIMEASTEDPSRRRVIVSGADFTGYVAVSPDGRFLLYSTRAYSTSNPGRVYLYDFQTGLSHLLVRGKIPPGNVASPITWSPDGRFVGGLVRTAGYYLGYDPFVYDLHEKEFMIGHGSEHEVPVGLITNPEVVDALEKRLRELPGK